VELPADCFALAITGSMRHHLGSQRSRASLHKGERFDAFRRTRVKVAADAFEASAVKLGEESLTLPPLLYRRYPIQEIVQKTL
jgi:hypothetical protein